MSFVIRIAFFILPLIFLVSCATFQNPFSEFYIDRTGGVDITKSSMVILPTGEPKIYSGGDIDKDSEKMYEDGYDLLGFSSFNAAEIGQNQLIYQAKKVKAEIVIFYSKYTNTLSGIVPLTLPDNQTVTTTYSGRGNSSGNIHGNNGSWASYYGSSNTYGTANTTIYGSKTTYIPYAQNRYDYLASYWIKMKNPILGVIAVDLTPEQRVKINSNKGIYISAVVKGSPAFMADIFKGDIITKINEKDIVDVKTLQTMELVNAGKNVPLTVIRNDKILTKNVRFSEGAMVRDVKYGNIAEAYYLFRNSNPNCNRTALVHFDKIFNTYQENNGLVINWDDVKADPRKATDPSIAPMLNTMLNTIDKVILDYGNKNQYRAIYSHKLPNINEAEDLTDTIISILNSHSTNNSDKK